MRLIDSALFRLALEGTLTLDEARALKVLYDKKNCSAHIIETETGLEEESVFLAMNNLVQRKIVTESKGIFFVEDFEDKISELIRKEAELAKAYN